jgi:hypothetical protein
VRPISSIEDVRSLLSDKEFIKGCERGGEIL